jgi:hypothetical protein
MPQRCFLATFRPLIQTPGGRRAAEAYGLAPFIDGSCRREPDFESLFPSITATCRSGHFAPRLQVADRVAYLTVKGKYRNDRYPGWRLVAVLRVIERFETHTAAAVWYRSKGLPLPSNCIVAGNDPKPFELTNRNPPGEVKARVSNSSDPLRAIRLWDAAYRARIAKWPVFLVCQAESIELYSPPQVLAKDVLTILGRIPGTLNPPVLSCTEFDKLLKVAERAA